MGMTTRRILVSNVTDAEQVIRGSTAWLNDPGATQVGVGVAPTERGDSVVVILLGGQVTEASAFDEHLPVADKAPRPKELQLISNSLNLKPKTLQLASKPLGVDKQAVGFETQDVGVDKQAAGS